MIARITSPKLIQGTYLVVLLQTLPMSLELGVAVFSNLGNTVTWISFKMSFGCLPRRA
jgi:hypothetical protein